MEKQFWNWTKARINLDRLGHGLLTKDILSLKWAHALAKDAVLTPWDVKDSKNKLLALNEKSLILSSKVNDKDEYLRRPDLGRKLSSESIKALSALNPCDLVFIISDGLSSTAIRHLVPFWQVFKEQLENYTLNIAPLMLVPFSRVAIADEIGFLLKAKLAIIFIGERPGLSSPDSLSIYLTYDPKPSNTDSDRNCISNICPPNGLSYELAVDKLDFLIRESLQRKLSGVELKEEAKTKLNKLS